MKGVQVSRFRAKPGTAVVIRITRPRKKLVNTPEAFIRDGSDKTGGVAFGFIGGGINISSKNVQILPGFHRKVAIQEIMQDEREKMKTDHIQNN